MHAPPKVAIIVPTLNRPHTLGRCLDSIGLQTFNDWTCVVINQGTFDTTLPDDKRFVYVLVGWHSASRARNLGMGGAIGWGVEYICLIDDDDWIYPSYMEDMVAALEANPDAVLVACNGTYEGKTYAHDHPSTKLVGSRMVRASAIDHTSVFQARSGQEKHFWRSFDGERQTQINKVLYHASRDPVGGLRDDGGSY